MKSWKSFFFLLLFCSENKLYRRGVEAYRLEENINSMEFTTHLHVTTIYKRNFSFVKL